VPTCSVIAVLHVASHATARRQVFMMTPVTVSVAIQRRLINVQSPKLIFETFANAFKLLARFGSTQNTLSLSFNFTMKTSVRQTQRTSE